MKILVAVLAALIAMLVAFIFTLPKAATALAYTTDATITRQWDKGAYTVTARIAKLVERDGKVTEEVIAQPRCISSPGAPASLFTGANAKDPDYARKENITMDVAWPEVGKPGFATCTATIKLGDKIVARTKTQVAVNER
jgi:hypothetical protein